MSFAVIYFNKDCGVKDENYMYKSTKVSRSVSKTF